MKAGLRNAVLAAAVVSTLYGTQGVFARDLIWDASGSGGATPTDGGGTWTTTSPNFVDPTTGLNTTFSSATPDSVTFGTVTSGTGTAGSYTVLLGQSITVQNLTFAQAANNYSYNLSDQFDGNQPLTLTGNIIKTSATGSPSVILSSLINLTAGTHTIGVRDSPGDDNPELIFNSGFGGSGGLVIDNSLNYAGPAGDIQYGTVAFNDNSSYTGGTTVTSGRLIVNSSGALGTGGVLINNAGALAFGGGGTKTGDLTINNAITISRSDYATANTNNRYTNAIQANNDQGSSTITLSSVIVNSTDARVAANTNRIVINSLSLGAIGNTGVLSLDGDYAGFVRLAGDNTAYGTAGGAIRIKGGVEVEASSEGNLGGPTSKLYLNGGTIHATGALGAPGSAFMTNFGAHDLSGAPVNTGVNLDAGQVFTVNNLSGTAVGTRGTGTINFTGTNVFTGTPYFDAGIANISGNSTFAGFNQRSSVVNIASGTTVKATNTNNEAVTVGSNNPDKGTLNIAATATLNDAGGLTLGHEKGTAGTLNNAGTITVGAEFWVGNNGGSGTFTQTAGSTSVNNWFAVARDVVGAQGTTGTANISGGTITKTGGGNSYVAQGTNGVATMTLSNNASFTIAAGGGEFWLGQDGGNGTLTMQDTASFTLNNWLALGRANGASVGVLNLNGGTLTKVANSGGYLAVGSGGTGTFNQTGGTANIYGTRLGEASNGTMNLSGGVSNFTGEFSIGYQGNLQGTLNISGTANVTVPAVIFGNQGTGTSGGTINLNGGTLAGTSFTAGATSTGTRAINFNGGLLKPTATSTNFIGAKITGNVLAGGAKIDTSGFDATVNAVLLHGGTAADGGLTKSGAGNLTLTGANTYTGATTITGGTVTAKTAAYNTLLTNSGGVNLQGAGNKLVLDYTGGTSPAAAVKSALDPQYSTRFANGQIRSTTLASGLTLGYADKNSQVTVMVTLPGDANLDGTVNFSDFLLLQANYLQTATRFDQGNFNYDVATDFSDFLLLQANYGSSINGTAVAAMTASEAATFRAFADSGGAVPEPASLTLIGLGAAGLLGRRRRQA